MTAVKCSFHISGEQPEPSKVLLDTGPYVPHSIDTEQICGEHEIQRVLRRCRVGHEQRLAFCSVAALHFPGTKRGCRSPAPAALKPIQIQNTGDVYIFSPCRPLRLFDNDLMLNCPL